MAYNHWFVSRQKRRLTDVFPALLAYSDICEGHAWNIETQLDLEDELAHRDITEHGTLRARRNNQGGGGTRTLFRQMKDLGLVFLEENTRKCRLTIIGDAIVKGETSFVEAMRLQLQRYQYPSAAAWGDRYGVSHAFRVHPFQFLFRPLMEPSLEGWLSHEETYGIVIFEAVSDDDETLHRVADHIVRFRNGDRAGFHEDTRTKTYGDIANTLFNYISITQYIDRDIGSMRIRPGKEEEVRAFVTDWTRFIPNPELEENYLRMFGRGLQTRDLRNFDRDAERTVRERNEARIRREYIVLSLTTPITDITTDIVRAVSERTGVDELTVEHYLVQNFPHGNLTDFFAAYRELAHMGVRGATDFEIATRDLFRNLFHMRAERVGQIGNTPDVFVESLENGFCGIIDNKAYQDGYSISGDHKRRMLDVYIPNYRQYGETQAPLVFFAYIAGSFGPNINRQLEEIIRDSGVNGSAVPVDLLIDFAQDYEEHGYTHEDIRRLFSVNREARLADVR